MAELDIRKSVILKAVVDEHVRTAEPVGSSFVATVTEVMASPATVRHEMATLEHDGYLQQPHISAGRIPTDKGYRYYVDWLGRPKELDLAQLDLVREFFSYRRNELVNTLQDTSRVLSGLTGCAAIVSTPAAEVETFKHIQLVSLTASQVMVVAVESNGSIERPVIELSSPADDELLVRVSNFLTTYLRAKHIGEVSELPPSGDSAIDVLSNSAVQALRSVKKPWQREVFVNGVSRIANAFDALDKVTSVLQILEEHYLVSGLISDLLARGQEVSIGNENGFDSLSGCALVVGPYVVEGQRVGSIGILGPTRLDYQLALSVVRLVSMNLGKHLSEGQ